MIIKDILNSTWHRPWPLSEGSWRFYQEWNRAIFLHWMVDIEELRKLVPDSLEIDVHEGKAWVSLVAFSMENIRPKNLPAVPGISFFDEINIRTYVKYGTKAGVYFLSIEAGNPVSTKISKVVSGLPYRYSKMSREEGLFRSSNAKYNDAFNIRFSSGSNVSAKSPLDLWLTERYALYQEKSNGLSQFEIHHVEWPVANIDIKELNIDYPRFSSLLSGDPEMQHYSKGVQVLAWSKQVDMVIR